MVVVEVMVMEEKRVEVVEDGDEGDGGGGGWGGVMVVEVMVIECV